MSAADLVAWITGTLTSCEIPHMIVGSFASSYWGSPRSTQDGDIVVAMTGAQLEPLLAGLRGSFYVPEGLAVEAVRAGRMFNVIDLATAAKVDLIVYPPGDHKRAALLRVRFSCSCVRARLGRRTARHRAGSDSAGRCGRGRRARRGPSEASSAGGP